jgi:hypothetical protein
MAKEALTNHIDCPLSLATIKAYQNNALALYLAS